MSASGPKVPWASAVLEAPSLELAGIQVAAGSFAAETDAPSGLDAVLEGALVIAGAFAGDDVEVQ
jgi:hypothetical protein